MYYYKLLEGRQIVSVEAKSRKAVSPGFVKATKVEYNAFIATLPVNNPEPVRDLEAEIDDHETRLLALEKEA